VVSIGGASFAEGLAVSCGKSAILIVLPAVECVAEVGFGGEFIFHVSQVVPYKLTDLYEQFPPVEHLWQNVAVLIHRLVLKSGDRPSQKFMLPLLSPFGDLLNLWLSVRLIPYELLHTVKPYLLFQNFFDDWTNQVYLVTAQLILNLSAPLSKSCSE